MARLVTIMGSGETAPTMVPVHRSVLEAVGPDPVLTVLDSAYGFQENADELTERAVDYFTTSFPGTDVRVATLRSPDAPAGVRERALERLRTADVVFAGPGSPTYALRTWHETGVADVLAEIALRGALTVASAASITVGSHAVPVYEIYKVGEEVRWADGLDVLGRLGLSAAVVPHFDNAEGGTHDTRFCWMGAARFERLRSLLPDGVAVLGVDEHTAAVLDLDAGVVRVRGRGRVTVLADGATATASDGEALPLGLLQGSESPLAEPIDLPAGDDPVAELTGAFSAAIERGDVEPALDAVLELEDTHEQWDDPADAHRALRRMVTRLGSELTRSVDADERRRKAAEALLQLRARARDERRFTDADALREAVALLGFEIRDTSDGSIAVPVD